MNNESEHGPHGFADKPSCVSAATLSVAVTGCKDRCVNGSGDSRERPALTRRPHGTWNPDLRVTICTRLQYNMQYIENLAGVYAGQAKAEIADCIVGGDRKEMLMAHGYSIWLNGQWACHQVPSLECARAYVQGVRETEKETV